MSWRYLQSTFPTLSGRSTLCPSCASKQRRSLGSTTANDIDLRQKISGNTAPSNSHQSQEVKEESSPVRIRFHRAQSVLTRPLHMGRAKVKHRRGPKVIKHPSRVIDHPFQLAVKDTGASSKTAVPRLHRLVPWGSAAPSIKYHPSGVDFAAQIDEQYAPDPQCRSVRIQKGLGHGTAAGPELALTLSLWDKQRHSQKDPVSDGNRRAFSSLAACASTKWASPKDLLGATAHHRSLYCASSTPHCSPLRPARLEPQRQGNGKRLLSSTTVCPSKVPSRRRSLLIIVVASSCCRGTAYSLVRHFKDY